MTVTNLPAATDDGSLDVSPSEWREVIRRARDEQGMTYFDWLGGVDEGNPPGEASPLATPKAPPPVRELDISVGFRPKNHAGVEFTDNDAGEPPPEPARFRVVARLWSVADRRGVLLRTGLPASEPSLDSIVDLFAGAAWYERETFEMFGIDFVGHPNLRKLLLTDEFSAQPLRKDFVLASRVVKPWPGEKEPGERGAVTRQRKRILPPGVPEPGTWGPPPPPTVDATVLADKQPGS